MIPKEIKMISSLHLQFSWKSLLRFSQTSTAAILISLTKSMDQRISNPKDQLITQLPN